MKDCRRYVLGGLKQAGWVVLTLGLIGAAGWAACFLGVMGLGLVMLGFAVSVLSGPIPQLLISLDISNRTLYLLWATLILPYWCVLGAAAGILSRRRGGSGSLQEPTGPSRGQLNRMRWTIELGAVGLAAFLFLLGACAWPPGGPGGGTSRQSRILNNLRQIDAAKQQFALEKHLPVDYVPTEAELAPYLGRLEQEEGIRHVGPERYVLNAIREPPYAVLDSDWRIRRRGWREGYTIPKQEFRLDTPPAPDMPPP